MFSQAGLYSHDSKDPFASSRIEYFKSDKNGEISFPHTKFTDYGVGGDTLVVKYICEGVKAYT